MAVYLGGAQVAEAAHKVGFNGDALVIAVAIAKAESTWQRDIVSKTQDYGLWQINKPTWGKQYDFNRLLSDAVYNAQAAWDISKHGTFWGDGLLAGWATYNSGAYRAYLADATSAVNFYLGATGQPTVKQPDPAIYLGGAKLKEATTATTTIASGPSCPWPPTLNAQPQKPHNSLYYKAGSPDGYNTYGGGTKQFQGRIIAQDPSTAGLALDFLYNPGEIVVQYSADQDMLPQNLMDPSQAGIGLATTTTLSFTLYFDRSLEEVAGEDVTQGVMYDINQLERICGITSDYPYFVLNRVKMLLALPLSMQFYASITGFTVHYTHFNWKMVPMRAWVDLQAIRLGKTAADDPVSAALASGIPGISQLDTSSVDTVNKAVDDAAAAKAAGDKKSSAPVNNTHNYMSSVTSDEYIG